MLRPVNPDVGLLDLLSNFLSMTAFERGWLRYDTLSVVFCILRRALLRLGVGDKGAVIGRGLSLRPQHFFKRFLPVRRGYGMEWNGMECR